MALITASPSNFARLLELQKLSVEHLENISKNIDESLIYQRLQTLEDYIIAKEIDKEEDGINRVEAVLEKILTAIKENTTKIISITHNNNSSFSTANVQRNSNSSTSVVNQTEEQKKEEDAKQNKIISILEKIEKNTTPVIPGTTETGEKGVPSLGAIATAIAVALGAVVAAIKSQVKAIKFFLDILTPDKLKASLAKTIASFLAGLSMQFDLIKASISEKLAGKFESITKIFDSAVAWVKGLFGNLAESKIGKNITSAFSTFMSWINKVITPFVEMSSEASRLLEGPIGKAIAYVKETFSTIGKYLGEFGSKIGKVAVVLEKFMLPLTVVMTVWDTVKGAIEGFEKEGIIGGIKGAITGLFNSLVFGPIDMIKDAIGWVAGLFGFDNFKKQLESFNLSDLFKQFVDFIFKPIEMVVSKIGEIFDGLKNLTIPEIGFKIPFTEKKISIGPFQPFKSADKPSGEKVAVAPAEQVSASNVAPASVSSSNEVAQRSSNITSMKEDATKGGTSNAVVAPSVNNNVSNTQVATLRAPVRAADPSFERYVSSRVMV